MHARHHIARQAGRSENAEPGNLLEAGIGFAQRRNSGSCAMRFCRRRRTALTLPDLMCGRMSGADMQAMFTCWPSSAWTIGPPPL
jgi:hypothetical protein